MTVTRSPRRGAAGQQYAIIVGLVGVVALLSVNILGNNVRNMFVNTGNTLGTVTNTGGAGTSPPPPPDTTPDAFNFTDITGASTATQIESAILQINGHVGVTVSVSGGGSPQFRICADATCSSVVQAYGSANQTIANGQYLQLRLTSSGASNTQLTATVTAGTVSDSWAVTTANQLFSFSSHTFTNCGQTGRTGPSQTACRSEYNTASQGNWDENSSYYTVAGGIQFWTVPETGTYRIQAAGAKGGDANAGEGAIMRGDFSLTANQQLRIIVGQRGLNPVPSYNQSGGGGASAVSVVGQSVPLIVAGGGGGTTHNSPQTAMRQRTTAAMSVAK